MAKHEEITFLLAITTEIKRSFETPVILVTKKDYGESIYKSLIDMRSALLQKAPAQNVTDVITGFHLEWLQAVREIDAFHKRIRDTPRDHINDAIDFSIECANKRNKQIQRYINQIIPTSQSKEAQLLDTAIENISDMHANLISSLQNKQKAFARIVDSIEYYNKVTEETEELLNWLDTLNDNLAVQFSKVTCLKFPELASDLSKTLREIIDVVAKSSDEPGVNEIVSEIVSNSRALSNTIRETDDNLEIKKIIDKVEDLEIRIDRLKNEDSSAVMALQHKKIYLEERLSSLQNLKKTVVALKHKSDQNHTEGQIRIFDHLLPPEKRQLLVEDLIRLWTKSLGSEIQDRKSIISILSVADMKEVFSDEYGKFTLDKYGRKLYTKDDSNIYQLNEHNELVPLDDDDYVYFYDKCGRYFFNENNKRIYKAHKFSSEYCFNSEGLLLKHKECREGREYFYDRLGRYFVNDENKRVYCDEDGKEFENDGLGNLVRIRNFDDISNYEIICPVEPIATEDNKYLQMAVGTALTKCIAKVVLCQPPDPILFLAKSLEDFRLSQQERQRRLDDEHDLMAEREECMREAYQAKTAPASTYSVEEELSYSDINFINYGTMYSEN